MRTPDALRRAARPAPGFVIHALAAAAALLLAACATSALSERPARSPGGTGDDCFFAGTLRDWRPLDESNLVLFASGRRPYHIELVRPAFGLGFSAAIGVYDRDGRICSFGGDAIVIDGAIPERIPIRSVRRVTEAELEELYTQFGVRQPVVIEAEEVELEDAETAE